MVPLPHSELPRYIKKIIGYSDSAQAVVFEGVVAGSRYINSPDGERLINALVPAGKDLTVAADNVAKTVMGITKDELGAVLWGTKYQGYDKL